MGAEYLWFVLLGALASVVSAVFGFGTALILLGAGAHILPVKEAIALATVMFAASTITKSFLFARHIDWRVAAMMALVSLPFAWLGASLMSQAADEWLRRGLGLMILIYLVLSVFRLWPSIRIGTAGLMAGSAAYGFLSGLLGSGNLVKAVIFREMNISKEAFVGAMAATSVLSNVVKLTAYSQAGLLDRSLLWPGLALVVCAIGVSVLGKRFVVAMDPVHFQWGLQAVLAVSALGLIL